MTIGRAFGTVLTVAAVALAAYVGYRLFSKSITTAVDELTRRGGNVTCPAVPGARYLFTENAREVWQVGSERRLMKPKRHPAACFEISNGVAGWRNPSGF